jgi:hypothetical protein
MPSFMSARPKGSAASAQLAASKKVSRKRDERPIMFRPVFAAAHDAIASPSRKGAG